MSQCKKFAPNIFHKTKCSNCFKQKEEHSAEALECNRASRSIARSGYLFVAPDWDFSVPLNRTKRWQRRWFVLYDDGELNYSVDEHPDTVPQGSVDMSKVLEVTGAEQVTGHPNSLALTSPDRVTFVKAASREDARWWAELLAVFPRRHKRNATFPGGRASPSLPQLGRSASPQPPRPRHLSVNGPSPRTNFETPPLREERDAAPLKDDASAAARPVTRRRLEAAVPMETRPIDVEAPPALPRETSPIPIDAAPTSERNEYIVSSGSPPTRDKLRCDDKARVRRDWNWKTERFKDIATALTDRSPESSLALPAEGLLHLKKGWLWVKSANDEWLKRWVVLCGPTLSVYQDQDEQNVPETAVELATVTNYNEIPTETKYGFEIRWSGPTLTMSAVTTGIRSNWMQALKKAAPIPAESPITPNTPTKCLLSSDEEYRTASEGGRRGSEDWSELPPSPPLSRTSLSKVKDKCRLRPRLPRNQSRQSTIDSTSTDELDSAKDSDNIELRNTINKQNVEISDLQEQLVKATDDLRCMEEEIARLKELQSDAVIREKQAKEQLLNFERTERELNQRNVQAETKFLREQRSIQRRLLDAEEVAKSYEEKYNVLSRELLSKQRMVASLQDELSSVNERLAKSRQENDKLFKKIQELEGRYHNSSSRLNSLTDLTNIDLDIDIDELGLNELKEYCLDLKGRFEKAVLEIRAVKKQLRESYEVVDKLELKNHGLEHNIEIMKQESQAEISLMVARLDHLTAKLNAAEKQLKFKSRTEARDKRRSLSLKGRESFSINKEVEDKVTELEAKIVALERGRPKRKFKRDRSSERSSPIDDKSLRRLRRKSLDSVTSSEQMKLLMRLSSLETKVTNVNASTESLNIVSCNNSVSDLTKCIEETAEDDIELNDIAIAKRKISECLNQISLLKNRSRRASSPTIDRLTLLEQNLNDLNEILSARCSVSDAEIEVIKTSASAAVSQLQSLLIEKLTNLSEKKRLLEESNKLDKTTKLQILAEKVAYENVLISRIKEALCSPANGETVCERLMHREIRETAYLINTLQSKLNGTSTPSVPICHMGAEHLTKILSNCLIAASQGAEGCQNFLANSNTPSLRLLQEEQKKLNVLLVAYKNTKLPQLAEALAIETINLSCDKVFRQFSLDEDTINEFNRVAREKVNEELIRNEINHILLRAAQIYKKNFDNDHQFFFSFFAAERAALELFSDSVREALYEEIELSIQELTDSYKNYLNKLQRQNWRRRVEPERLSCTPKTLLNEFADIVAHKALIDARINVLSSNETSTDCINSVKFDSLSKWLENDKYWACLDSHSLVQTNQSLEAEFICMVDKYSKECKNLIGWQPEVEAVIDCLNEIAEKVYDLQKFANVPVDENDVIAENWDDVCKKCRSLRDQLDEVRFVLQSRPPRINDSYEEPRLVHLGTEYLTQVENLRAAYRCALESCKERHQEADIEQLQNLCERVLVAIEQWHRRTIQDLREAHAQEMEALKQDKEQALAEETQATLAALDAMRKAHEAEVQREVARFKQEFARQQRDDIMDLSEKLSVKCLEAAALEEQLGSATRQLAHAQQHILQLERNPQLSSLQN